MPSVQDWQKLMTAWNQAILQSRFRERLPIDLLQKGWLGRPGASQEQIEQLQQRLGGVRLPPSYQTFLAFTNGWDGRLTQFIKGLWPSDSVSWYSEKSSDLIEAWFIGETNNYTRPLMTISDEDYLVYGEMQYTFRIRSEYLKTALEISAIDDDGQILLLNPKIITEDGEWEAWFFAPWMPGAKRYRTFWELMQAEYQDFL